MTRTPWLTTAGQRLSALLAESRFAEAQALALQLLGDEHRHSQAAVALAQCAVARNDLGGALRWAERAFRLTPKDHSLAALYGALLIAAGRPDEAELRLAAAVEATPLAMPRAALAQSRMLRGDTAGARPLIERLLAQSPVSAVPLLPSLADHLVQTAEAPGWMAADRDSRIEGALRRRDAEGPPAADVRIVTPTGPLLALPLDAFLRRFGHPAPDAASPCARFSVVLGPDILDGAGSADVTITVDGTPLIGSPVRLPRRLEAEGAVFLDGDRLQGWAWLPSDPQSPAELRVSDAAGHSIVLFPDQPVSDAPFLGLEDGRQGFSVELGESGLASGWLTVSAGPAATPLAGSPVFWPDQAAAEHALVTRAGASDEATRLALAQRPVPIGPRPRRTAPPEALAGMIDIIVPVHAGHRETMACLSSVLETVAGLPCTVVVVEDASPEPELVRDLAALAAQGRITLLSNDRNLGFPATVNRGFRLHPDRDVVVLNADTLVTGDWLPRLRAAAYAAPDIGTATPFSNDATILSYPGTDEEETGGPSLPSAAETAALHRAASRANPGTVIDLPTAVAFCTYIRRDCLAETGPFEEILFGRGYGEENDFCLRARRLGWRHVAAADVFVAHIGGRSFGRSKRVLMWRNIRVLNQLHPGYDRLIGDFLKADPLAEARRRMDLARWFDGPAVPSVLLINLDLGGGVSRHIGERCRRHARDGLRPLLLSPCKLEEDLPPEWCRLEDPERRDLRHLLFRTAAEIDELTGVLRRAGVGRVEIHHTLNHDPVVLDLPARLGVPYDMVIHDYSWICPRITMIGPEGRHCGEPALTLCEHCAVQPGPRIEEAITVADLRRRSGRLTAGAHRVVVPSEDVARRLARHVPPSPIVVEPWDDVAPAPEPRPRRAPDGRWTVCLIGAVGDHKGRRVLLECARDAARRGLPLDFTIVGYTDDDGPLFATGHVFVTGRYDEEEALALVRAQGAHIAFLPSICPETWCYALSTAWQAGLEVVAFDLGAIGERIRKRGGGHLLDPDLPAPAINDALLGILDLSARSGVALQATGASGFAIRPSRALPHVEPAHSSARSQHFDGMPPMLGPTSSPATGAQPTQIVATAQKITFSPGLFSVVVVNGRSVAEPGGMPLPSLHLAPVPTGQGGRATLLGSLNDGWLVNQGDALVVKVEGEPVQMILTSYKDSGQPDNSLSIQMARLDTAAAAPAASQPAAIQTPRTVPFEVMAHIRQCGDLRYPGTDWAGRLGEQLWIEGFSITLQDLLAPEDIEYKGLTANGWETPWIAGGKLCGSRGLGTPLIGFAIRLRGSAAERYDCVYQGAFVSGQRPAASRNGSPCRSDAVGDALEGFLLRIVEKTGAA